MNQRILSQAASLNPWTRWRTRKSSMEYLWVCLLPVLLYSGGVAGDSRNHTADALQRLLRVFGMEGGAPNPRHHPLPPQYMLDLYRSFADGRHHSHHGANTVRSFFDKESNTDSSHFYFDLSKGISDHEEVVEAQFHFFTNHHIHRHHQDPHIFQMRLYDGTRNSSSKLVEARTVTAHSLGWEVFRITTCVKKWMRNADFNKGLTMQVLDRSGREWPERRVRHLQGYRYPILIVFSYDPKTVKSNIHRSISKHSKAEAPALQSLAPNGIRPREKSARNARAAAAVPDHGDCARQELRVDFERLGWSSWIISPKWYDAYVCSGACAFPLGQNQRPTNHATVQSIVHELGLTAGVEAPCCVPTDLHSVSLLYFDEHMNVVLKQYDDMVAAGCGCQ